MKVERPVMIQRQRRAAFCINKRRFSFYFPYFFVLITRLYIYSMHELDEISKTRQTFHFNVVTYPLWKIRSRIILCYARYIEIPTKSSKMNERKKKRHYMLYYTRYPNSSHKQSCISSLKKKKKKKSHLLTAFLGVNNVNQFLALRSRRQVLVAVLSNENVVLDAAASYGIVSLKDVFVDELGVIWVGEIVSFNVLAAEIAIHMTHPLA